MTILCLNLRQGKVNHMMDMVAESVDCAKRKLSETSDGTEAAK